jgi:hypothetical protein
MIIFTSYSHDLYDDIDENNSRCNKINIDNNENIKDCTICLEKYSNLNNEKTHNISHIIKQNYKDYNKKCGCDYVIHTDCFNKWFIKNTSCIICRKRFNKIQSLNVIIYKNSVYFLHTTIRFVNGIIIINYSIFVIKILFHVFAKFLLYWFYLYYFINLMEVIKRCTLLYLITLNHPPLNAED